MEGLLMTELRYLMRKMSHDTYEPELQYRSWLMTGQHDGVIWGPGWTLWKNVPQVDEKDE